MGYSLIMSIDHKNDLFEFRFHYHLDGSAGFSDKYFLAHNFLEAKDMFEYACNKRATMPTLDKVEKWNRWADRWEDIDFGSKDPFLN
jgi:hypothetical protein